MHLLKNNVKLLGLVLVLVIGLAALYAVDPSFLNLGENTTVSISEVKVLPQGAPVGDEWQGSFWNILAYVGVNDQLAGVVLPKGEKDTVTFDGAVRALETGARVEIRIDPGQAYIIHPIQEATVDVVVPKATGTTGAVTEKLSLTYYRWVGGWEVYTPFTVSVYKDGNLVGQRTFNAKGTALAQEVDTSEGKVRIENLGTLGGNYLQPNMPSQICIFKGAPYVYDWTQVYNRLDGSAAGSVAGAEAFKYSDYWFGVKRNSDGYAYNPTVYLAGVMGNIYPPSQYGGWVSEGVGGKVSALRPVVFPSDEVNLPVDKRGFYCVTEWLHNRGVTNLASNIFNTRAAGNSASLWQSASFTTTESGQTALRLDVPWSAFGTPLVNIRVPTELADTWVEQPIETDVDVSAVWSVSGSDQGEIQGSHRIKVTLTNRASSAGSVRVTASSGNAKLLITPGEMTVNNLVKDVPQVVFFDATNLGVETQVNDVPVTIKTFSTYTGTETGSVTIYGTLLPTLTSGTTTLNVRAVERGSDVAIPNLRVTLVFPPSGVGKELVVYTGSDGQTGAITLETLTGSAYVGDVQISSVDTELYHEGQLTYSCSSASSYQVTFEVERKDTDYPDDVDWLLIALIFAIIVSVVAVVGVVAAKQGKGKRGRVKRR